LPISFGAFIPLQYLRFAKKIRQNKKLPGGAQRPIFRKDVVAGVVPYLGA